MKNTKEFVEKFGKGIRGFGVVFAVVLSVLLGVSIARQCNSGAEVQFSGE